MSEEAKQVMAGEIPFITFFNGEETEDNIIGELFAKEGVLSFRGKASDSAKMFFEELKDASLSFMTKMKMDAVKESPASPKNKKK